MNEPVVKKIHTIIDVRCVLFCPIWHLVVITQAAAGQAQPLSDAPVW